MRRVFAALALAGTLVGGWNLSWAQDLAATLPRVERWSLMVGGGYFAPAVDEWKERYGRSGGWLPVLAGSYLAAPWLSIRADAGYWTAESAARNVAGAVSVERQQLTLIPITLSIESLLRWSSDQFAVPFVGIGYRRVAYRLAVDGKDDVRGGANGWTAHGGFDVLLNALDPSAASGLREETGIARSYFRIEAQWAKVNASGSAGTGDIDLGGKTFLAGLKFEF